MHSVEVALATDYLRRGLWIILVVLLTITALPVWLIAAMRSDGALQPGMREAVVMHVTLTLVMGFGCAIAVYQAHGKLVRHFIRPISSARLVACQMGIGMLTIAGMYVIAASIINLGGTGWPILGPAMFLAATLACSLAAIWSLEGSSFAQLLGCLATTAPLVIWFNRCYGARIMGDWQHMWNQPTALEALALGSLSLAAFGIATFGVARARRGDVLDFGAVLRWWERQFVGGLPMNAFASPRSAQAWFEWQQKMGGLPALLLGVVFMFALLLWMVGYMESKAFLEISGTLPLVSLTFVVPLVFGLMAGNCGHDSGKPGMRFTLATRPVTDTFIAFAILRNCLRSLATAWGLWLVGWSLVAALVYWSGERTVVGEILWPPHRSNLAELVVMSSAVLLISWTFTTLMASSVAAGRPWLIVTLLCSFFGLLLSLSLLKQVLLPHQFETIVSAVYVITGTVFLTATVTAFVVAGRLGLISAWVWLPSAVFWLVTTGAIGKLGFPQPDLPFAWNCLGCLSLPVLPLAALPLAIRANRHR